MLYSFCDIKFYQFPKDEVEMFRVGLDINSNFNIHQKQSLSFIV